jgi:ribosomal protein L7/L12
MSNTLEAILMKRDGMTLDEAKDLIEECRDEVRNGMDPEEVLHYDLGLEPDYVFDLLEGMI